jgi:regulatory protein YycH of two-component signal transduction system YycFG
VSKPSINMSAFHDSQENMYTNLVSLISCSREDKVYDYVSSSELRTEPEYKDS